MVDANVLFSAFHLPNSDIANMLQYIMTTHSLVLCQYIIDEMLRAIKKKYPQNLRSIIEKLNNLPFEMFVLPFTTNKEYPHIKDLKDIPVLVNAIESQVDILITGDTDFDMINIDKPKILKPRQFQNIYM